jgi:2-oxoisovalerate dehydrogenase E1 component
MSAADSSALSGRSASSAAEDAPREKHSSGEGDRDVRALHRALLTPRLIEEKMLRLLRQGRLSKWFSGWGQEAVAVGCAAALRESDWLLPMHRNLGLWTTRGVRLQPLFCQLFGREGGYTRGRDRTFHFGLPEKNIVGMISHMAAMLPVACGLGLAAKIEETDRLACAFVGDGGTREGDFHEALNLASVWALPVVFVVENNGYGLSTPTDEAVAPSEIADAAAGYDLPGRRVDGNDLLAVMEAVEDAAERARAGDGPTLLEMKTFRVRGHEEASGTAYVPDALIEEWKEKDPVERFERKLLADGALSKEDCRQRRADLEEQIDRVAEEVLGRPVPQSTPQQERAAVFAPPAPDESPLGPRVERAEDAGGESDREQPERRLIDAVSGALRHAMRADERVLLMGQDIAEYGGVFKVTEGFLDEFGPERVRNTPIIESGAVGAALGLAVEGFRPVVELQYADFVSCGFNQIVNNLATTRYRWGEAHDTSVNVTLRMPYGGGLGAGPFHSQSMEAWFCHTPGLKVVCPATPAEAKGLLLAALADPNPVLVFEQKKLYRSEKGPVPTAPYRLPLERARVAREGADATVVTYGLGVRWALEEAERLAENSDAQLEVIDLRTLAPWDRRAVRASLEKTSRLLVLHEAPRTAGFGAEVAAEIAEDAFTLLDAPPARVGAEDTPVPAAPSLEDDLYSARAKLRPAIERLLAF